MKTALTHKTFASLLMALSFSTTTLATEGDKAIEVADVGFATPESVEYDAAGDIYLVTNINGGSLAVDGNGFISKLAPDGKVIELKWIDGANNGVTLNAPKGAAIVGDNLWVTDIDQVHVFALSDGQQKKSIKIEGSTFLNGITPGAGDYVYVTDSGLSEGMAPSGSDAIYKVWASGKYEVIVKDKGMGRPNGIWDDNGRLVVVTFGSGKMFAIDRSGRQIALPTPPHDGLDGLVKLADGRFLISSWGGSAIYALDKDDNFTTLADSLDAPADLGVDTKRQRVLIPLFKQNKVVILPF
ncbi:hypothetical protein Q9L42_019365 [Methylomarinum sp. Ch1-1]|uniref:Periplasmic ATP/GTP-binding protein n=1 Tax=Methylomarinum roseum TaxID=3067653 RepID=A0AAU7NU76_9GAMM|nr:hypothetical protein [Methylomarinum sp. Ch1-1]MDP4519447.1 hypothetical protein [Methylomarinum sp. Ch1-1]